MACPCLPLRPAAAVCPRNCQVVPPPSLHSPGGVLRQRRQQRSRDVAMTTHSSQNAVAAVATLQPGLRTDAPGYFVAGAGAPVVLLHSSLSSKSQWIGLAERLASRFRVIAVD